MWRRRALSSIFPSQERRRHYPVINLLVNMWSEEVPIVLLWYYTLLVWQLNVTCCSNQASHLIWSDNHVLHKGLILYQQYLFALLLRILFRHKARLLVNVHILLVRIINQWRLQKWGLIRHQFRLGEIVKNLTAARGVSDPCRLRK